MKDVWVRNKFGLTFKVLLGALAWAVVIGFGATVHAAADEDEMLFSKMEFFDPFTLTSIYIPQSGSSSAILSSLETRTLSTSTPVSESGSGLSALNAPKIMQSSGTVILGGPNGRPPIRIPFRPVLRSPVRPPLP